MFLIVWISFFPLGFLSIIGLLLIAFPKAALTLKHYDASMGGSLFDNYLEFTTGAITMTRVMGFVFIGAGLVVFLLVNGWLDFLM